MRDTADQHRPRLPCSTYAAEYSAPTPVHQRISAIEGQIRTIDHRLDTERVDAGVDHRDIDARTGDRVVLALRVVERVGADRGRRA